MNKITHTMDDIDLPWVTDAEYEQRQKQYLQEIQQKRRVTLQNIVPMAFAETEESRLPQEALSIALRWASNIKKAPLNLLLAGDTGVGKTRIAWLALAKRFLEHGQYPTAIGAESFVRRLQREPQLMGKLVNARLLLFDDLGKERTTPTAESAIFELVRERMDNKKPTIYTTNFAPTTLLPRFSQKETGEALCRRLRESCYAIPVQL